LIAAIGGALRRPGVGRAAFRAGAAASVAAAIAGPWYVRHWSVVSEYTTVVVGEFGQGLYSRDAPLASLARWSYYPVQLANAGVGWVLAAASIGAVVFMVVAPRPRRLEARTGARGISIALWSSLGAWILLTYGQISGQAYYALGLAPPLVIVVVSAVLALPRRSRAATVAVLFAAAAFNMHLASRDPEQDREMQSWGPFVLGQKTDPLFSAYAVHAGVDPRRDRETWPNRRFAEEILIRGPRAKPVVAESAFNMYCGRRQLEFEAVRLRREIEAWAPEAQLQSGRWQEIGPRLAASDFLLVHGLPKVPFFPTLAQCTEFVRSLGLEAEIVADVQVTPDCRETLVRIARPRRLGGWIDEKVAHARPGHRIWSARAAGGWRLEGVAAETAPDGAALWTAFFDAGDVARPIVAELTVRGADRRTSSRTIELAPPPTTFDRRAKVCAATFELDATFDVSQADRVEVVTRAPATGEKERSMSALLREDGTESVPGSRRRPGDK
jgi:hypothetical protein